MIQLITQLCVEKKVKIQAMPDFVQIFLEISLPFSDKNCNYKKIGLMHDYTKDQMLNICLDKLPNQMINKLFNFQKEGIQFGIKRHGRIILADEMGVGKTVQALGISYIYRSEWPLIIFAPSQLKQYIYLYKSQWKEEILKWLPDIHSNTVSILDHAKQSWPIKSQIVILSYEIAQKLSATIEGFQFKSYNTKRTKALMPILMKAKRVLLISGTPMISRPNEIYNIIKIVRPDITPFFHEFAERYCNPQNYQYGTCYNGSQCTQELNFLLTSSIMIRRLKKTVLDQLPPKIRQKIEIKTDQKISGQVFKLMNKILDDKDCLPRFLQTQEKLYLQNQEQNFENQHEVPVQKQEDHIFSIYQLTGTAKIPGIIEFIQHLVECNVKFIIFAYHMNVLDAIEVFMNQKAVRFIRIDGSTSMNQRTLKVSQFQTDDFCLVAILGIHSCAVGLNLTSASTIVFAEMFWTPSMMTQAEDRAHRIGQKSSVNIYYLFAPQTIDDVLYRMLQEKHKILASSLDGEQIQVEQKDKVNRDLIAKRAQQKNRFNEICSNQNGQQENQIVKDQVKIDCSNIQNFALKLVQKKLPVKGDLQKQNSRIEDFFKKSDKPLPLQNQKQLVLTKNLNLNQNQDEISEIQIMQEISEEYHSFEDSSIMNVDTRCNSQQIQSQDYEDYYDYDNFDQVPDRTSTQVITKVRPNQKCDESKFIKQSMNQLPLQEKKSGKDQDFQKSEHQHNKIKDQEEVKQQKSQKQTPIIQQTEKEENPFKDLINHFKSLLNKNKSQDKSFTLPNHPQTTNMPSDSNIIFSQINKNKGLIRQQVSQYQQQQNNIQSNNHVQFQQVGQSHKKRTYQELQGANKNINHQIQQKVQPKTQFQNEQHNQNSESNFNTYKYRKFNNR